MVKPDPTCPPLIELRSDIFGNKNNVFRAANQLVFFGLALGSDQCEDGAAIRRRNCQPTPARFVAFINDQIESKLVNVEPQTSVLIADEDVHTENAKIRILPIQTNGRRP